MRSCHSSFPRKPKGAETRNDPVQFSTRNCVLPRQRCPAGALNSRTWARRAGDATGQMHRRRRPEPACNRAWR